MKSSSDKYRAVKQSDADTCKALNWAWMSVAPFVLATGSTEEQAEEAAWEACPEAPGIYVHEVR